MNPRCHRVAEVVHDVSSSVADARRYASSTTFTGRIVPIPR